MKVQNDNTTRSKKLLKIALFMLLFITVLALISKDTTALVSKEIILVDRLQADLSMTESLTIILSNNTDKIFSITLPDKAHNIVANENLITQNIVNLTLNCTDCNIRLSYDMDGVVNREIDGYVFYRTLHFPENPELLRYMIYLPSGYTLNSTDSLMIVPSATDILTDGTHIIVGWAEKNPQLPKQYYIKYQGQENKESIKELITEDLARPETIMIIIIVLVIGLVVGFMIKHKITQKQVKILKMKGAKAQAGKTQVNHIIPSSLLSPDEKIILDLLKQKDAKTNPVNQKDIGKELNWSKSKVSAVLSNLYYKKIIDREKFGRNYKVKLIKDVSE